MQHMLHTCVPFLHTYELHRAEGILSKTLEAVMTNIVYIQRSTEYVTVRANIPNRRLPQSCDPRTASLDVTTMADIVV